jgi:hypothetical protein
MGSAEKFPFTHHAGSISRGAPALPSEHQGVFEAMLALPKELRTVLWHAEILGRMPGEIAEVMSIKADAVPAIPLRARETCAKYSSSKPSGAKQHTRGFLPPRRLITVSLLPAPRGRSEVGIQRLVSQSSLIGTTRS